MKEKKGLACGQYDNWLSVVFWLFVPVLLPAVIVASVI